MKKTLSIIGALSLSMFLGACAEDEEALDNQAETEDEEEFTDERADGIKFDYFEIDVEYPDMLEAAYEVEYEKEDDGLEASLDDNINGEELDGAQAFETLYPIFTEQLTFDETTDQEEIVSQLVKGFNLREDFEFMEVDIDMSNGESIEFEAENN
ncbi:YusW family protein [Bacillus sp. SG-1]|uniref:YusW family protein n=1 Tax=Bacillus sp. SG-1 TaxID=161544 RepID=UPI00015447B8|nr:YusW family protein [Bacillus sp. SG-1]EDL63654.1 hypothetical protein BSG1_10583 [Bacillus sp. SG-1]